MVHIVLKEGVKLEPQKMQAITKWPIPKKIKVLRRFFRLTWYYWSFVKNYACISSPLTYLLKKISFIWNDEATLAFSLLMDAMSSTPTSVAPTFGKTFIVECEALGQGIYVTLTQ